MMLLIGLGGRGKKKGWVKSFGSGNMGLCRVSKEPGLGSVLSSSRFMRMREHENIRHS